MSRHDVSCRDMVIRNPVNLLPLTEAVFQVLLSLADGQKHGYAILKEVAERTGGRVELSTGTLYGIVKRLLADGLIVASVAGTTDRRQAYRLTPFGRNVALAETERLQELVSNARAKKVLVKPSEA
jgi:DNA-binding PadR family transcriptional regulator